MYHTYGTMVALCLLCLHYVLYAACIMCSLWPHYMNDLVALCSTLW